MTTKLAGQATQFLPFNLGHDGGAGNPPNPAGHRTAYLWERVWARDAWMDILARFIHVERPAQGPAAPEGRRVVIFPRFHQWDAVLALEADAETTAPGRATWSSTRPARASPTRSPGPPTGCRRSTTPTTRRSSTR